MHLQVSDTHVISISVINKKKLCTPQRVRLINPLAYPNPTSNINGTNSVTPLRQL